MGAYYCWRLGDEWEAKNKSAPAAPPARAPHATNGPQSTTTSASTAPMVLLTQPRAQQPTIAKTNKFPYRLSNTTKSVGDLLRNDHAILLENALVDTKSPGVKLAIPAHLRAQGDPGSYIVQACGPVDNAFRARLRDAGATIISYIPNNAYLVRASASSVKQLQANVCAVLPFEPYYKLKAALLPAAVRQEPLPEGLGLNVVL